MAAVTFLIPVPEGKAEHFRRFSREAVVHHRETHHKSRQKHGYTKEKVWLHRTPFGEMLVVYLEGKLPEASEAFRKSKEPHDIWMKEQILGALNIDLEKGPPPEGELIFDYEA